MFQHIVKDGCGGAGAHRLGNNLGFCSGRAKIQDGCAKEEKEPVGACRLQAITKTAHSVE